MSKINCLVYSPIANACQKSTNQNVKSDLLICESDRLTKKCSDLIYFYWKIRSRMRLRVSCIFYYKDGCKKAQLVKQGLFRESRTLVLVGVTTRCAAFPFHRESRLSLKKRCHCVSLQLLTKWHLK